MAPDVHGPDEQCKMDGGWLHNQQASRGGGCQAAPLTSNLVTEKDARRGYVGSAELWYVLYFDNVQSDAGSVQNSRCCADR